MSMTIKEYAELIDYIEENNYGWNATTYEEGKKVIRTIEPRYISIDSKLCIDTVKIRILLSKKERRHLTRVFRYDGCSKEKIIESLDSILGNVVNNEK